MITHFLIAVMVLLTSHLFHEFGHLLTFHKIGKTPILQTKYLGGLKFDVKVGYPSDYEGLTRNQLIHLYLFGIIFGTIPIFIAYLFNIYYAFLILPYLTSCSKDIKNLWRQIK